MNINYSQVRDCTFHLKQHVWNKETIDGEIPHYGKGVMKQLNCLQCGTIKYIEFSGVQIQDIHGRINPNMGKELAKLQKEI